jgi:hypothetical protein
MCAQPPAATIRTMVCTSGRHWLGPIDAAPAVRGASPVKQTLLQEKYPLFVMELNHDETALKDIDAICAYFRQRIDAHRCARFIAEFDHYAHTCSLPEGDVAEEIVAARNIIFCFGIALPCPQVLGLRPRSIGIAETPQGFVISFMEAPMPIANAAMEDWAEGLRRPPGDVAAGPAAPTAGCSGPADTT